MRSRGPTVGSRSPAPAPTGGLSPSSSKSTSSSRSWWQRAPACSVRVRPDRTSPARSSSSGSSGRRSGPSRTTRSAKFRALVNKASDMITVVDPDLVVTYQSTSVERVFGHPVAEVVGKGLSDLMHPEDAESVVRALQDLAASPGSTGTVEYRLRHRDGSWRHVETAATNLISDHLVRGVVLNTRDVTRRVEAERTLQRLQAERAELLGRTVQAAEQERKRLSAELHDGPVQHLAALDLLLEGAGRRFEREGLSTARENVGQVQER